MTVALSWLHGTPWVWCIIHSSQIALFGDSSNHFRSPRNGTPSMPHVLPVLRCEGQTVMLDVSAFMRHGYLTACSLQMPPVYSHFFFFFFRTWSSLQYRELRTLNENDCTCLWPRTRRVHPYSRWCTRLSKPRWTPEEAARAFSTPFPQAFDQNG